VTYQGVIRRGSREGLSKSWGVIENSRRSSTARCLCGSSSLLLNLVTEALMQSTFIGQRPMFAYGTIGQSINQSKKRLNERTCYGASSHRRRTWRNSEQYTDINQSVRSSGRVTKNPEPNVARKKFPCRGRMYRRARKTKIAMTKRKSEWCRKWKIKWTSLVYSLVYLRVKPSHRPMFYTMCVSCVRVVCACIGTSSYKCRWLAFLYNGTLSLHVFLTLFINRLCPAKSNDDDDNDDDMTGSSSPKQLTTSGRD